MRIAQVRGESARLRIIEHDEMAVFDDTHGPVSDADLVGGEQQTNLQETVGKSPFAGPPFALGGATSATLVSVPGQRRSVRPVGCDPR